MLILLADANMEVLAALRLFLEQKPGYQVIGEVTDAVGLYSQVTRQCPDVVILDAGLHGLKKSKKESRTPLAELVETLHVLCPSIYLIALSSLPNLEMECLLAGADAFVCKSDPPDALFALLQ